MVSFVKHFESGCAAPSCSCERCMAGWQGVHLPCRSSRAASVQAPASRVLRLSPALLRARGLNRLSVGRYSRFENAVKHRLGIRKQPLRRAKSLTQAKKPRKSLGHKAALATAAALAVIDPELALSLNQRKSLAAQ